MELPCCRYTDLFNEATGYKDTEVMSRSIFRLMDLFFLFEVEWQQKGNIKSEGSYF